MEIKIGERCNFINQPERLFYIGRNWSGNGYWHQFKKVGDGDGRVWCEVVDCDMGMIEVTV
jgi:hypothetical protein